MSGTSDEPARSKCELANGMLEPCNPLARSLEITGRKGLSWMNVVNINCGETVKEGAMLRSGEFVKKGIVLNFCPFCGADIGSQFAAKEEAAS